MRLGYTFSAQLRGAWKISPGKTVKPTGSFISGGFFPDATRAAMVRPDSQYSRAEEVYPNLIYFNEAAKGGHFAAWEEPQLFSEELRAAFRSLR